ncbi:MAG: hypothetical protein KJ592_03415 [Nanoarchaeota archaeon]|nr:hypothetical protein [Nanoarchaeota archaeon]
MKKLIVVVMMVVFGVVGCKKVGSPDGSLVAGVGVEKSSEGDAGSGRFVSSSEQLVNVILIAFVTTVLGVCVVGFDRLQKKFDSPEKRLSLCRADVLKVAVDTMTCSFQLFDASFLIESLIEKNRSSTLVNVLTILDKELRQLKEFAWFHSLDENKSNSLLALYDAQEKLGVDFTTMKMGDGRSSVQVALEVFGSESLLRVLNKIGILSDTALLEMYPTEGVLSLEADEGLDDLLAYPEDSVLSDIVDEEVGAEDTSMGNGLDDLLKEEDGERG